MNYARIYGEFIADRRAKESALVGYVEVHHVMPRSEGGTDEGGNLVTLSATDHLFAHVLLARVYPKQRHALAMMLSNSRQKKGRELRRHFASGRAVLALPNAPETNAKIREALNSPEMKAHLSAQRKGVALTEKHRTKIRDGVLSMADDARESHRAGSARGGSQKKTEETKRRMSEAQRGHFVSADAIEKMRAAKLGKKKSPEHIAKMRGRVVTDETRLKLSSAAANRDPAVNRAQSARAYERGASARFLSIPYHSTSIADVIFYRHCTGV